jgi:hypothetical protein
LLTPNFQRFLPRIFNISSNLKEEERTIFQDFYKKLPSFLNDPVLAGRVC